MNEFKYQIDDTTYIQKPLVLGQIRQLMGILKGLVIPKDADAITLVAILGDKLPHALAVALTPEGVHLKDKDIDALAKEIEFTISPETTLEVVEHFFDLNPISSLLEKLNERISKVVIQMIGSKSSALSSPEETSPKETRSSGDTPSGNASPILSSENGK